MALYIKDDGVDALAEAARQALGVKTKTAAVETALRQLLAAVAAQESLHDKFEALRTRGRERLGLRRGG